MPQVFEGSIQYEPQSDITLNQNSLNQSAETLESANNEIVLKLVNVVESDLQFQKDYRGSSKSSYHSAINTLYGRCHNISEVQLHYAEELEILAIEGIKIDEEAKERAEAGDIEK